VPRDDDIIQAERVLGEQELKKGIGAVPDRETLPDGRIADKTDDQSLFSGRDPGEDKTPLPVGYRTDVGSFQLYRGPGKRLI